jgi:hypothetical protein
MLHALSSRNELSWNDSHQVWKHTHPKDTHMHVMYANEHCADQNMLQIQNLNIFMFIM